jgi:hypothetical protein
MPIIICPSIISMPIIMSMNMRMSMSITMSFRKVLIESIKKRYRCNLYHDHDHDHDDSFVSDHDHDYDSFVSITKEVVECNKSE